MPDLADRRRERMPELPQTAWFPLAPDWACQVLSASPRTIDLTHKRELYAEHGVAPLGFVDPDARTLEAFALRRGDWMLIAALRDDAKVRLAPFDAIVVPLAWLCAD